MTVSERISYIIEGEGLNKSSFSKKIGVNPQTIQHVLSDKDRKPGFDVLHKILVTFPHLDANWLMTGEGEMYKVVDEKVLERRLGNMDAVLRGHDRKIEEYEERIKALEQQISGLR